MERLGATLWQGLNQVLYEDPSCAVLKSCTVCLRVRIINLPLRWSSLQSLSVNRSFEYHSWEMIRGHSRDLTSNQRSCCRLVLSRILSGEFSRFGTSSLVTWPVKLIFAMRLRHHISNTRKLRSFSVYKVHDSWPWFCLQGPWTRGSCARFLSTRSMTHGHDSVYKVHEHEEVALVFCLQGPWLMTMILSTRSMNTRKLRSFSVYKVHDSWPWFCLQGPWTRGSCARFLSTRSMTHGHDSVYKVHEHEEVALVFCLQGPWLMTMILSTRSMNTRKLRSFSVYKVHEWSAQSDRWRDGLSTDWKGNCISRYSSLMKLELARARWCSKFCRQWLWWDFYGKLLPIRFL